MLICMYGCMEKSQINRVLNEICTQLGMLRCKIFVVVLLGEPNTWNLCFLNMNSRKHQKNTRHTCMYIYFCIYTYLWKKLKPSINVHVCMHAYMYVWMYGTSQINRVLNEICTQLGMLRCKILVVVLLGEPINT